MTELCSLYSVNAVGKNDGEYRIASLMAERLPIYDLEEPLLARLKENRRLILSSPTGSGKSTQVPQMLLKHGLLERGQVVILQPRRLATRLLAARVAEELGVELGREVGYQIRFDNVSGPKTKIKFVTEGILLRQMIQDPVLNGISALIFDEFHERHLYGDITLARALDLQEKERPDLNLLVMSATLDGDRLETYLKPCARLVSEGRTFPVTITHAAAADERPAWEQAADAFSRHVRDGGEGDVLVFMPGGYEIARTIDALRERAESKGYLLLPLHGELPPRDQDAAVARYSQPKIVVSTNVAETSLTIDGIRLVIDSGLARIPRYDPYRGINTLGVEKISRASADQRAGRAGRTAPGECLRLWTAQDQGRRPARELPEIRRLDLSEVVLTLKSAGVGDLRKFRWLDPPDEASLAHSEELLGDLGALKGGGISDLGRRMLAFPIHPRYSRMLLAAQESGCVHDAALVAALTQGRDLLLRHVDGDTASFREDRIGDRATSDFFLLIKAWAFAAKNDFRLDVCRRAGIHAVTARQVGPLHEQLLRIAEKEGLDVARRDAPDEALRKCILIGFSDRVARRADEGTLRCELVHGRKGVLARESVVRQSPLLVAAEIREVEGRGGEDKTILSLATAIETAWLEELFADDMTRRPQVFYDPAAKRVLAEEWLRFRDLVLEKRRVEPPPADAAARLLAEEVMAGRIKLSSWDASVDQWILRLDLLARTCPELEITPITEADRRTLIEHLCHGAVAAKDVKDRPVKPVFQGWLNPAMQGLVEKHAPERLKLANGKTPKVTYVPEGAPFIALRIQDLYGVTQLPKLALARVMPLLHILAPSNRPVQITQDLPGFWKEHYPKLRKELQRKYPRHEWRDVP
ncbi:MAG: ATP-dependent helicase HrpB [Planctomycetes bacterium]|nr:ATP-dependent helicase HrpB [Planctomycetota bacterium]